MAAIQPDRQPTEPEGDGYFAGLLNMLPYPRIVVIELLAEHLEEVAFLWGQRREAITSGDYRVADIAALDRRMEMNVRGSLAVAKHAVPLAVARLQSDDPDMVFAAGIVLLRLDVSRDVLLGAMSQGQMSQRKALREAFCFAWQGELEENLQAIFQSGPPQLAVVAAEVLAFQRRPFRYADRQDEFFRHEEAEVRAGAWRIVSLWEN